MAADRQIISLPAGVVQLLREDREVLVLEVSERAVMGRSESGTTKRYQHLPALVRHDVAARVGGLLWRCSEGDVGGSPAAALDLLLGAV